MAVSLGVIYGRKRSSERRAKEGEVERKVGGGKKLYLHAACQVTSPRGLNQGRVAGITLAASGNHLNAWRKYSVCSIQ
jgi:hypothetical protein